MSCCAYFKGAVIKTKGGVGLFQISQKERLFHLLWQPSALGDNLTMCPPLHPSKKGLSFCFSLGKKIIYLETQLKREFTDLFWKLTCNTTMNSFIINNIIPYAIYSLEDKPILVHFRKAFPITSLVHSFERRAYYLLLCFENYQGIPYSHTGRVDRGRWTLC